MTTRAHLGVLLVRALAALTEDIEAALAGTGYEDLGGAQSVAVLEFLAEAPCRITRLARLARVSKQAMSQMVTTLERRGYVAVSADPADTRAKLVSLTPRGVSARQSIAPLLVHVETVWRARYGDELVTRLAGDLETISGSRVRLERPPV